MSGTSEKVKGKVDQAAGKGKEKAGKAFGDRKLENEGKDEQLKGKFKETEGDIKDAVDR